MTTRTVRWGTLLLILAVLTTGIVALVAIAAGPAPGATFLRIVLPSVTVVLGVGALFAGHVSYPRVQNLRVYLAGYSVGVQAVVYALLRGFDSYFTAAVPVAPAGFSELGLALALIGAYLYSLLPGFPTYRTTRITTLSLAGLQIALMVLARFAPASFSWLSLLVPPGAISVQSAIVATVTVGIIVLNAVLPVLSFYLRGAFSGLAFLAGCAWLMPVVLEELAYPVSSDLVFLLAFAAAPLILAASILAHVLARMDHRASYDPLLQVYNRDHVDRILSERTNVPTRPPFAVLMIDIDHFKLVNDTHGHQAGDKVLQTVAAAIQRYVVPEGILCRYGGEELIVFFPDLSGRDIVPLAKRIRENIELTETHWKRQRIGVTISIGISDRKFARQPLAHVVQAADRALYIAKENGRNQVRFVRLKDPRKKPR